MHKSSYMKMKYFKDAYLNPNQELKILDIGSFDKGGNYNYGMILRRFDESSWLINTTMGALLIIVGIVSIFTRNGELVRAVGICLFFYGAINLVETIILRRRSKYFL